ncbi:MAG TPA: hypothetical protein VMZ71_02225 [Gemmataceae bacterium]|nr:hypothetical protein [Gemmataceae bacterium]
MTPLPAPRALDQFFLEARSKLLDLAAFLDRVDRGDGSADADPRAGRIDAALKILLSDATNKAEQIQQLFSLEYDPEWKRPQPRF